MKKLTIGIWFVILGGLVTWWMNCWFGNVLPLTPREENIPELSYWWNLYHVTQKGMLFSPWNPTTIGGSVNLIQRGYILFAPLALISSVTHISPDILYKISVGLVFFTSGIGMCFYLRKLKIHSLACLTGGFIYMFAPPHLAIGIEGFDFNVYWALIPWIMVSTETFIQTGQWLVQSVWLGLLLTVSLLVGTTYFASTMPIFLMSILIRLVIQKTPGRFKFLLLSCVFFLGCSAFITLPSALEAKESWINQETLRKQVVNIISLQDFIGLFAKKVQGHSVLSFKLYGNFTDLSWYLGISTVFLSFFGIFFYRKQLTVLYPLLFLLLILVPFYGLAIPAVKSLALVLLKFFPRLQAIYDHTFRLFLPIIFSLATLSALGANRLADYFPKQKLFFLTCLFILCVWDFLPFQAFFRSEPLVPIQKKGTMIANAIKITDETRYWSPFPYRKHLPLYRYEYFTRYLTPKRLNSAFLYVPFAPRYSAELYDVRLVGALETQKEDFEFVRTLLDWGNTSYIILHPEVADYSKAIAYFEENSYKLQERDSSYIILKNEATLGYLQLFSTFTSIPKEEKDNLIYWYQSYKNGVIGIDGNISISGKDSSPSGQIIKWSHKDPSEINADVVTSKPSLLVLSESWFPGWNVIIDNQRGTLFRANYAFMGTIIPPGKHSIKFFYKQPVYYAVGKFFSLSSFTFIFFILINNLKKNSKKT